MTNYEKLKEAITSGRAVGAYVYEYCNGIRGEASLTSDGLVKLSYEVPFDWNDEVVVPTVFNSDYTLRALKDGYGNIVE